MKKSRILFKVHFLVLLILFGSILFSKNIYAANDNGESQAYIIPDSVSRYLNESELADMPLQILNYAKNEIYAREGRIFRSKELREYFEQQSWYQGIIQPDDFEDLTMLNDYEYVNTQLISKVEHNIKSSGYKPDQPGYSYEPVYQYIANRNTGNSGVEAQIEAEDYQFYGGNKVVSVSFEEKYTDTEEGIQYIYGEIKGMDSKGEIIWERKTNQYVCAGYAAVRDIGENGKFYYYEEGGKIVKLGKKKGKVQWTTDIGATVPITAFGADGALYVSCEEGIDFTALSKDGEILTQIDNIAGEYIEPTDIRYLGKQVALTFYGSYGNESYLINLDDFSYHKREYNEKLDWYGGISDFSGFKGEDGAKVVRYADEDVDNDDVTELLACMKDENGTEKYYIWKKDLDMPLELVNYNGEQKEVPVKALYYEAEKGMLVAYSEQSDMQTYSYYTIEDSEIKLNYCVYQKCEGMRRTLYLYEAYGMYVGELDQTVKMLEYGMNNDEAKKAAGIVWKGYIDKLSKFKFQKP